MTKVVDLGTKNSPYTYTLAPSGRKGFYRISAASFEAVVSRNTAKLITVRDGENKSEIQRRVEEIRNKAFS
jgi:hypothetical protein